jgi:hypothetical protein
MVISTSLLIASRKSPYLLLLTPRPQQHELPLVVVHIGAWSTRHRRHQLVRVPLRLPLCHIEDAFTGHHAVKAV